MFIIRKILHVIFCRLLYNVKYVNKNLEKNIDKCVIVANHSSFADPIFLYTDVKDISVMAKSELFKNKFIGKLFSMLKIFPINRGKADAKSILHAVNLLKDKEKCKVLIFPEGTRVKEGKRVKGKVGAVYVALKAKVPILPVKIVKKYGHRSILTPVTVIYDDPIFLDETKIKDKEYLEEITNVILDSIYNLEETSKEEINENNSK